MSIARTAPGEEGENVTSDARLNRQIELGLENLHHEFADQLPASLVTAIGQAEFERLHATATITDFIPLLVYRYAREELVRIDGEELHRAV
jgi:hypothetical protein